MSDSRDIDATELVAVAVSADGRRVRLRVRDQTGRTVRFSLPANWLNSLLKALPAASESGVVHPLDSWSMERTSSLDLVLTLRTPEGKSVSFAIKSWQIEGMATIATYGNATGTPRLTLH